MNISRTQSLGDALSKVKEFLSGKGKDIAILIGARKIGKTWLVKRAIEELEGLDVVYVNDVMDLKKIVKKDRVVIDDFYTVLMNSTPEELESIRTILKGRRVLLVLSPYQHEWLVDNLSDVEVPKAIREKLREGHVIHMTIASEKEAKEIAEDIAKGRGLKRVGRVERHEYEYMGEKFSTYIPHDAVRYRPKKPRELESISRIFEGFSKVVEGLIPIADLAGKFKFGLIVPLILRPEIANKVISSLRDALGNLAPLMGPMGVLAAGVSLLVSQLMRRDQLIVFKQLHWYSHAELEREERRSGIPPGILEGLREAPLKVGDLDFTLKRVEEKIDELRRDLREKDALDRLEMLRAALLSDSLEVLRREMRGLERSVTEVITKVASNMEAVLNEIGDLVRRLMQEQLCYEEVYLSDDLLERLGRVPEVVRLMEEDRKFYESLVSDRWVRGFIEEVIRRAERGPVIITGSTGVGKTTLLYLIWRYLHESGYRTGYIYEGTALRDGGGSWRLDSYHVDANVFLFFDNLTTAHKLMFGNIVSERRRKGRLVIMTAREGQLESLLESVRHEDRDDFRRNNVLKVKQEVDYVRRCVKRFLERKGMTVEDRAVDILVEKMRTKGRDQYMFYYLSFVPKHIEGNVLSTAEAGRLPSTLADFLIEDLLVELDNLGIITYHRRDEEYIRVKDEIKLAATILSYALVAYFGGECPEDIIKKCYMLISREDIPLPSLEGISTKFYPHDSYVILLDPSPLNDEEFFDFIIHAEKIHLLERTEIETVKAIINHTEIGDRLGKIAEEIHEIDLRELRSMLAGESEKAKHYSRQLMVILITSIILLLIQEKEVSLNEVLALLKEKMERFTLSFYEVLSKITTLGFLNSNISFSELIKIITNLEKVTGLAAFALKDLAEARPELAELALRHLRPGVWLFNTWYSLSPLLKHGNYPIREEWALKRRLFSMALEEGW